MAQSFHPAASWQRTLAAALFAGPLLAQPAAADDGSREREHLAADVRQIDLIDRLATTTAPSAKPVYTVPTNSTLMGSIAMTAVIGRVPIDGTVNDPYPFKVLIGPDNLTANGIDIPDVAGAVVSGTASGDWTLSCVRGQIRSVTFVFNDGTVRTLPEDGGRNSNRQRSNDGNGGSTQDGLGWISDPYGIPCVSGERRERFYRLAAYPEETEPGEVELASGSDFAQRLFFGQPRSDLDNGVWSFDGIPTGPSWSTACACRLPPAMSPARPARAATPSTR